MFRRSAIVSILLLLVPYPTWAQQLSLSKAAVKNPPASIEVVISRLSSGNESEVRSAITDLGRIRSRAAVVALCAFLKKGQPDSLADFALETLGKTASPDAVETLIVFTNHRRPAARLIAYQALAAARVQGVSAMVARALSDSDPKVRSAAATALGTLGAKEQLPRLFIALERGVSEAAVSIGQLGDAESARLFTSYINQMHLATALSGYQHFLERKDIDEKTKIEIVNALSEQPVPDVKRFLQTFLKNGGAKGRVALKKTIDTTIARIRVGPKAAPKSDSPARPAGQGGQK
jgi:HEAT repeat protein